MPISPFYYVILISSNFIYITISKLYCSAPFSKRVEFALRIDLGSIHVAYPFHLFLIILRSSRFKISSPLNV